MKVSELVSEICSRAGEGYQNYSLRAKSHFRSAAISLANATKNIDVEAPGLYSIGERAVLNDTQMIAVSELLSDAGMDIGTVKSLRYGTTSLASLVTELENDNDLKYVARPHIPNGNLIGIEYVVPETGNEDISISVEEVDRTVGGDTVTGYKIIVSVGTGDPGVSITKASDIIYIWDYYPGSYYASVSLAPNNDGAGEITAMEEQMLSGGAGVGEYLPLERITKQQHETSRLRPGILESRDGVNFYTLTGQDGGAMITLIAPPPFNARGAIEYSIVGWRSLLDDDNTEVELFFSPIFLERVIELAADSLRREIQA